MNDNDRLNLDLNSLDPDTTYLLYPAAKGTWYLLPVSTSARLLLDGMPTSIEPAGPFDTISEDDS